MIYDQIQDDHGPDAYLLKAKRIVVDYINEHREPRPETAFTRGDVYIVWFNKTLLNWKALLGTNEDDALYYEVTYNGAKQEAYLDVYLKTQNLIYRDDFTKSHFS